MCQKNLSGIMSTKTKANNICKVSHLYERKKILAGNGMIEAEILLV